MNDYITCASHGYQRGFYTCPKCNKEFTCEKCGGTFEKNAPDDKCREEADINFGKDTMDEMAIVCDDCFRKYYQPTFNLVHYDE